MQSELSKNQIEKGLLLLQLSSSAFPSGSYTHSSGFEALVDDGTISDADSLEFYLRIWLLESVARCDGPAVALTHRYMADEDVESLLNLSAVLSAMKYSKGTYDASVMVGRATLNSLVDSFAHLGPHLKAFVDLDSLEQLELHHALIWGIATNFYGVDVREAVSSFLFTTLSGVLEVVARIMPLGQKDTQKILGNSYDDLFQALDMSLKLDPDQLSSQSAIHEIAAIRHERLPMKLCIT